MMSTTDTSEKGLEAVIVESLIIEAGYAQGRTEDLAGGTDDEMQMDNDPEFVEEKSNADI